MIGYLFLGIIICGSIAAMLLLCAIFAFVAGGYVGLVGYVIVMALLLGLAKAIHDAVAGERGVPVRIVGSRS